MATPSTDHSPIHVLLVGQIYLDTILEVDHFPEEDHKLRARRMEQRRGGNCGNTAELLAQFPGISVSLMSALGAKETCGWVTTAHETNPEGRRRVSKRYLSIDQQDIDITI